MKLIVPCLYTLATTLAVSEASKDNDNTDNTVTGPRRLRGSGHGGSPHCPEYCRLYAEARERCPADGYDSGEIDDIQKCVAKCVHAVFDKDGYELSFNSDSLQCRMNYARMAIKQGDLTNSKNCLYSTIAAPGRCYQDSEAEQFQQNLGIGKYVFYNPTQAFASNPPEKFQMLIAAISFLITTRDRLYVTYPSDAEYPYSNFDCTSTDLRYRSANGTCNSISEPNMGAVSTPFARNLQESTPHTSGDANVADVAKILKRDPSDTASVAPFNQLATGWIQFMTHDWFAHDEDMTNKVTHWWDASQIYGSSEEEAAALRVGGGKLLLDANNELDYDADDIPKTGFSDNFWVGLHVFHTIFIRERNYVVDSLKAVYPTLSDDELYGTARNIISLVLAKIHTLEWTPTLLDNEVSTLGLNTNWYGLRGVLTSFFQGTLSPQAEGIVNSIKVPSVLTSEFTTDETLFDTPFSMTEEFVSVYRMHNLLPDEIDVEGNTVPLQDVVFTDAREIVSNRAKTTETLLKSLASTPARTLTLNNYPYSLYNLEVGDGATINLAEIDIARDRERGIPRYNDARRQLMLEPYSSIDELTCDAAERAALKGVYEDIEQVDFMVGCLADQERPEGFAFGVVPYFVFLVMASRRIFSDRFFQEGLTPENYTPLGLQYIVDTRFQDILERHFPDLAVPVDPFSNDWAF